MPSGAGVDIFAGMAPTLKYLEMTWGPLTCRSPYALPSRGSSLLSLSTMRMFTSSGGLPCATTFPSHCQCEL